MLSGFNFIQKVVKSKMKDLEHTQDYLEKFSIVDEEQDKMWSR